MLAAYSDLNGASVFITGGGSGIGAALTEGFVAQGARVAFADIIDASALCADLEARYGTAPLALRCDITDTAALCAAMEEAAAVHGPIRVLVNNAADDLRQDALKVTPADWDKSHDLNLKPYFFACQAAAPGMIAAGGGSIINFSSTSYMIGSPDMAPYVSANAGIMGLTRALAREWGPHRIRVNSVAPGWVMTDKQKAKWVTPEAIAAFMPRQCLQEMMQPEDVVGGVLFLASDASRMMTSQMLTIDAGLAVTG